MTRGRRCWWRKGVCGAALSGALVVCVPGGAQESAGSAVELVSREARSLCAPSSESGRAVRAGGDIDASMKSVILRRLLGAEAGFQGEVEFEEWDGVQQVLRDQQHFENEGIRTCVQAILPILAELQSRAAEGRSPAPPRARPTPRDGACLDASVLLDGPVPVEAGTCFSDGASRVAQISSAGRDVVVFSNADGEVTRCRPSDRCAFGFADGLRFGFMDMGGKIYLVRKQ